jgi:hypothetical protein
MLVESMAIPIQIGGTTFRTKKEAKDFYISLRDRHIDGVQIAGEDDLRLRELLANHPEANDKIGVGIAFFCVATETRFGRTRHFVVHRIDGSFTDFSFHSCIDGRNEKRDRLEALRGAVEDQIVAFRNDCFAKHAVLICPLRGVSITRDAYHVDHEPPEDFQTLVGRWLASEGFGLADVRITPPADNQIVASMTDVAQIASWQKHHRETAKLRMLSPLGNLSDARRGK